MKKLILIAALTLGCSTTSPDRKWSKAVQKINKGQLIFIRLKSGKNNPGFMISSSKEILEVEGAALDTNSGMWASTGLSILYKQSDISGVSIREKNRFD